MKIKIESDVFDIVERIRQIDDGYFIVFNTDKNYFEVCNENQKSKYCFSVENDGLDSRVVDNIYKTNIVNIDKMLEDIDKNNYKIENNNKNTLKDVTVFDAKEIYDFSSNSSKCFNEKDFSIKWS